MLVDRDLESGLQGKANAVVEVGLGDCRVGIVVTEEGRVVDAGTDIGPEVLVIRREVVLQCQRRWQQPDITNVDPGRLVRDIVRRHGENELGRPVLVEEIGDVELRDDRGVDVEIATKDCHVRALVRDDCEGPAAYEPRALRRLCVGHA